MREILFRGKTDVGLWVYGFYYKSLKDSIKWFDETDNTWWIREVIPETVGQYIGLNDCNGQKIFDGDIILINGKYPKIIKWGDDCACFLTANIDSIKHKEWMDIWTQPSKCWWKEFGREIEVIGNIHDNPELMEK